MPKTLPASTIQGFSKACDELGLDAAQLLARACLNDLDEFSEQAVDAEAVRTVLERAQTQSGCEHFALLMVKHLRDDFLGSLAPLLASAPDLEAAWRAAERYYQKVRNPDFHWLIEEAPPRLFYKLAVHDVSFGLIGIDLAVAKVYHWHRAITDRRWQPSAVCFRRSAPMDQKPFRQFFKAQLIFNADFDGFVLRASDRNMPLAQASIAAHWSYLAFLQSSGLAIHSPRFADRVFFRISQGLADGQYRLPEIARHFRVNARTLQRQLADSCEDYTSLLARARLQAARFYLANSNLPVTEIALRAGFQNARSFSRFFKEQTGVVPLAWRRQQIQPASDVPGPG